MSCFEAFCIRSPRRVGILWLSILELTWNLYHVCVLASAFSSKAAPLLGTDKKREGHRESVIVVEPDFDLTAENNVWLE
jgi:hypothetical protein